MRLYYMTATTWAELILREHRIKLSRFSEANDPFELSLVDYRDPAARRYIDLIYDHFEKTVGFICFGASWESPVMWAHYAEKHTGVALGFDVPSELSVEINYTDSKIQVPFGPHLPKHGLSEQLLTQVRTTKATDWKYEREYRVESELMLKDSKTDLYYVEFGPQLRLREVVIGHRCTWTTTVVRDLIGKVDHPVRICKARPAYGRFAMVHQQLVKPLIVRSVKKTKRRSV